MDKIQTYIHFWESFGWEAYDENSVPKDAPDHYITYEVNSDSFGNAILVSVSLWDYNTSWGRLQKKAEEIAEFIVSMHPPTLQCDTGRIYITKGVPFAQRMEGIEAPWKRMLLNVNVEFLTNY